MGRTSHHSFAWDGVYPQGSPRGASRSHAECLVEGGEPHLELTATFSQTVERQILDAGGEPVERLTVAGRPYSGGTETVEHELSLTPLPNRTAAVRVAGRRRAELREDGALAGAVVWRWEHLHATVEAWIDQLAPGMRRLRIDLANRLEWGRSTGGPLSVLRSPRIVVASPDGLLAPLTARPRPRRAGPTLAPRAA